MATDTKQDEAAMLIEAKINSNQKIVQDVKASATKTTQQMSTEDFKAWLDKH